MAVQNIVLVPLFLVAWGPDVYGNWLVLLAVISYLSLMDLGGQNYIANLLALEHSRGDEPAFRQRLSEGVSLFGLIGIGGFALLTSLILALVQFRLPAPSQPLDPEKAWTLWLLAANTLLLSIPFGVYVMVYRTTGLFSHGQMVGNLGRVLGLGFSIGLLLHQVSPKTYAGALLAMAAMTSGMILWDTRKHIPACRELRLGFEEAIAGWRHVQGSIHFWFIAVATEISQQGATLILAALTSPLVVAVYVTHRTFAGVSRFINILLYGPLLPELSFLWAQERLSGLRQMSYSAIRLALLLTGAAAVVLWVSGPILYPAWTRSHLEVQPLLLGILLAQNVLSAGWVTSTWSLLAANRHRPLALWSLCNAALALALALWFVQSLGAVGVALAGLVADIMCGLLVYPVLTSSFLNVPATQIYSQLGSAGAAVLLMVGLGCLLSILLSPLWAVVAFVSFCIGLAWPAFRFVTGGISLKTQRKEVAGFSLSQ